MSVLVVLFLAGAIAAVVAGVVFRFVNRDAEHATHGPVHATARAVQHELETRRRVAMFVRDRLSPARVTGLALTAALAMLVAVAVLAFEVRRQSFVARGDLDVADWAARHANGTSTDFLRRFTDLGSTVVVLCIAAVVAMVEVLRTRARGVIVFLAVTVVGVGLANDIAKGIVGRSRPDVDRLVHASGMSFPSGHSAAAAACFAACALCLSRGRGLTARLVITVVAAALAVMVATSRVLLGVHWASDAFAGLCFGASWFALCAIAFGGRLLRFGAPVEAAVRVDAATGVEVTERAPGEPQRDDDGHHTEHGTEEHIGEEVHAQDHP
jgi:undecaprenyl-diphosphatase